MGTCTSVNNRLEVDPYNAPAESEAKPVVQETSEKQEEKVLLIQSLARVHKAKLEVAEKRQQIYVNCPLKDFAVPLNDVQKFQSVSRHVKRVAENLPYKCPKRREFRDILKLPPQLILATSAMYLGQWIDGRRHGKGTQIWPDGSLYEGEWANDKANGNGRLIHPDGDFYEGEWINDQAQGKGKGNCGATSSEIAWVMTDWFLLELLFLGQFQHVDGTKYSGDWAKDKQHGNGQETQKEFVYSGEFSNGQKHGKGRIQWITDGSSYEGEFQEGEMQGEGRFDFEGGKRYVGGWFQSRMHGQGVLVYPDGRKYIGNFEIGQKSGSGVMLFPDGKEYSGQWKNGKQHGNGTVNAGGKIISGVWESGKCIQVQKNQ